MLRCRNLLIVRFQFVSQKNQKKQKIKKNNEKLYRVESH